VNERPQSEAEVAKATGQAELNKEPITQSEHREDVESGRGGRMTEEEFRTILYRFQTGLDWSRRLDSISRVVTEARRKPRTPALRY
jgi:hypothetical protein